MVVVGKGLQTRDTTNYGLKKTIQNYYYETNKPIAFDENKSLLCSIRK